MYISLPYPKIIAVEIKGKKVTLLFTLLSLTYTHSLCQSHAWTLIPGGAFLWGRVSQHHFKFHPKHLHPM